ncbi:MAG: DUF2851 family protein, partial [Bacteroidia bacterium]|nr:DUF2851 family protein [Bacteroidia bacterium]
MTEEFLHYLWKYKRYNSANLSTQTGEVIQVIKQGEHNTDAGPDFFNSKLKIGKTIWAGNVEIHIHSSDWKKHNHQSDKAYDNVILHVVYRHDEKVYRKTGEELPTLELKGRFDESVFKKYLQFKASKTWVPCAPQLKSVESFILNNWLERMLVERLERKSGAVLASLEINKNNWEETFYQHVARSFGFKVNSDPFELLARSIPNSILAKHKNSLFQVEALLFGQAGLLDNQFVDTYPQYLQNEYAFLRKKYKLTPLDPHVWKFLRLRPSNFPTVRIAQFASLIFNSIHLFSKVIETNKPDALKKLFSVRASEYWETHYMFDKKSAKSVKSIGPDGVNNIIINTIVPFLFVYGKSKAEEKYVDLSLALLEKIEPENNSIIDKWEQFGVKAKSAYQTQALLQLKNEYCS